MAEPNQPTVSNEHNIFITDLIEITRKDDIELKKFIDYHLFPEKSPLSIESISNNISILKEMNSTQQALVKGRARNFEELNDPSKSLPSLLAIFGFVLSLYALLRELTNGSFLIGIINFLVIAFVTIYASRFINKITNKRSTAVYFNTILNSIYSN